MTGPTPSFGSLDEVTRSLGDVTEHAAENRKGVNRRIVRFIVIYRLYLRRPDPRHRMLVAAMQHTPVSAAPGPDSAKTRASPAMPRTTLSAALVARIATVPPLPPPVIFAPNKPRCGPAARTSSTMASVPVLPKPQAL